MFCSALAAAPDLLLFIAGMGPSGSYWKEKQFASNRNDAHIPSSGLGNSVSSRLSFCPLIAVVE